MCHYIYPILYIYRFISASTLKAKYWIMKKLWGDFFSISTNDFLHYSSSCSSHRQFSLNLHKTVVAGKLFLKLAFLALNYLNKSREELAASQPVSESRLTTDLYLTLRVTARVSHPREKYWKVIYRSNISLNLFRFKITAHIGVTWVISCPL